MRRGVATATVSSPSVMTKSPSCRSPLNPRAACRMRRGVATATVSSPSVMTVPLMSLSSPQPARCLQDEEGRCYSDSFLSICNDQVPLMSLSSPQPARCLQDEEGRCYSDSFLELPSRLPEEEEEAAVRQMVDGDKMEAEEEEKPALKWVPLPDGGASPAVWCLTAGRVVLIY